MLVEEFPRWLSSREFAFHARAIGDEGLSPGLGRSPGGGYDNPFQYCCMENLMNRAAWQTTVYGVEQLSMHL